MDPRTGAIYYGNRLLFFGVLSVFAHFTGDYLAIKGRGRMVVGDFLFYFALFAASLASLNYAR